MSSRSRHGMSWPCTSPIFVVLPIAHLAATEPIATTTNGLISSTWRSIHGAQLAISPACGVRFFGGRHLTTLVIATVARDRPTPSSTPSKSWPDLPTKGSPVSSSWAPGASPTTRTLAPLGWWPTTTVARVADSPSHRTHDCAADTSALSEE